MTRVFMGRCLAALFLFGWTGSVAHAAAERMDLILRATGAYTAAFQLERLQDDLHTCALLGPRGAEQTLVLTFNASQSDMLLPPSDFGFSLSVAGRVGSMWTETQPSAIMQVSIGKRVFLGLHASDRAFRLQVSINPGGATGTFSASHLRDTATGQTIDVTGSWRCADDEPPQTSPAAPSAATPAPASPSPPVASSPAAQAESDTIPEPPVPSQRTFRIYHAAPCQGIECRTWTATEVRSGKTFAASVRLKDLKISRELLVAAQEGRIELWITGQPGATASGRQIITAKQLDGVSPRRSDSTP
jgi:hypothetical protein